MRSKTAILNSTSGILSPSFGTPSAIQNFKCFDQNDEQRGGERN